MQKKNRKSNWGFYRGCTDIVKVQPLPDYCIYVQTEDGRQGVFDMKPYLERGVFKELKDVHYFNQVGILFGAVTWPHDQDIAPETLLAGLTPLAQAVEPLVG